MTEHQQKPSIGRIVHYTLSEQDADHINRRRAHAKEQATLGGHNHPVHVGNSVSAGDVHPMTITRTWGDTPESSVNGQVMLDGNDLHWVTSRSQGEGNGHFQWPSRV